MKISKAPARLNVDGVERLRAGIAGLFVLCVLLVLFGLISAAWLAAPSIAVGYVNRGLFRFFNRHRGLIFAVRAVLFHQIYYLYSAAAFVYVWAEHHGCGLTRRFRRDRSV